MKKFLSDPESVLTDPADVAIIKFVEKMTLNPSTMTEADTRSLRDVGFEDVQILEICALCAQFNYVSRMADALGVELEEHYLDFATFLGYGEGPNIKVEDPILGDAYGKQ